MALGSSNVGFNGFSIFLTFKLGMFGGRNNLNRIFKPLVDESISACIENYYVMSLLKSRTFKKLQFQNLFKISINTQLHVYF